MEPRDLGRLFREREFHLNPKRPKPNQTRPIHLRKQLYTKSSIKQIFSPRTYLPYFHINFGAHAQFHIFTTHRSMLVGYCHMVPSRSFYHTIMLGSQLDFGPHMIRLVNGPRYHVTVSANNFRPERVSVAPNPMQGVGACVCAQRQLRG